jgi:hypothetical protein
MVVLLGSVLVFKSAGSQNPSLTAPIIVASGSLTHHNKPFELPMYTPTQDGVFRVSVYPTLTQSDPNSESAWYFVLVWTDGAGPGQSADLFYIPGNSKGPFLTYWGNVPLGGSSTVIQAKANTPIIQSMGQNGNPDNSAYSLFYVVEQLQ